MTITRTMLAIAGLLLFAVNIHAQEKPSFKFGKVSEADFAVVSPVIDSNTNAVVLADVGKTEFVANQTELSFYYTFNRRKRIKIINKNGFDAATITLRLYVGTNGREEKLQDLKASTYNLDNGNVTEIKLEKSALFSENTSKHWITKKFTFPGIKEGSIIEFSYQIKSDFLYNLQPWAFQGSYPVLWSQYEARIPEFFKYRIFPQGYQPFAVNTKVQSRESFRFSERNDNVTGFRADSRPRTEFFNLDGNIDNYTWVMKDVPALKEEAYTSSISNYIAKITFQLNQIAYPNSTPKSYTNSWEAVSEELLKEEKFGLLIKGNGWLDNDVASIVKGASTTMEKAFKVYAYVRDNFTCTNHNSFMGSGSLRDVWKLKSGSVADLNLLLVAMLRQIDVQADPVILSTRSNGVIDEGYPEIDRFNYVVAKIAIDTVRFYADASHPRLAFAHLPLEVYNGHGRVINDAAEAVYFDPKDNEEGDVAMVVIYNNDKGLPEGSFSDKLSYYKSLDIRNRVAKSSVDEFKKSFLQSAADDVTIENFQLDSVGRLNDPIQIKYDLKFKNYGQSDIVYFNPLLDAAIKKNPFVSADRNYPVEMPYSTDDSYILNMEIPKGYTVDELPKSARIKLNDDDGMFEYLLTANQKSIQMRCRLVIKQTKFTNEDYQTLRDFYSFVVKKEAEQIVFKKIK